MAIRTEFRQTEDGDTQLALVLTNGDKERLERIVQDWNFKDPESFLTFAAVICDASADKKTLGYRDENNLLREGQPKDSILKDK
jgi:hypothetical protein